MASSLESVNIAVFPTFRRPRVVFFELFPISQVQAFHAAAPTGLGCSCPTSMTEPVVSSRPRYLKDATKQERES
jgi:hypothetical protein